jgi:hypothetical protein
MRSEEDGKLAIPQEECNLVVGSLRGKEYM